MSATRAVTAGSTWRRTAGRIAAASVVSSVAIVAIGTTSGAVQAHKKWAPKGVLSFAQAKAEGKVGSINWGAKCDTTRGTYAYPSINAMPCFAPFTGNNGGATAQGVTATTIKVVVYLPEQDDPAISYIEGAIHDTATIAETEATLQEWNKFFNTYAELYGRQVDLIPYVATGESTDPVAARADALTIADDIKPFAVLNGPALETTSAFATELASKHILCINGSLSPNMSYYQKHAPYLWQLGSSFQQQMTQLITFLSREVAGHKAVFAGSTDLQSQTRKFGVVALGNNFTSAVLKQFSSAHIKIAQVVTYASPLDLLTSAPTLMAKLEGAGVTSVIFDGDPVAPQLLTAAAAGLNYYPEWIISGSVLSDTAVFGRTYNQAEWAHAFGVSFGTARTATDSLQDLYKWFSGSNPPDETSAVIEFASMALLFPVLQGVGPDVTAQNFENSIFSETKPKEMITSAMYTYGKQGIWPYTDFCGVDDATVVWWNATVSGPDELNRAGKGLYEYVDGGQRYLPSAWPKVQTPVFQTNGAVTIYATAPAGEQPPNYPSPA